MIDIRILFIMFIAYSIIGWGIEVINNYIYNRNWVNRGFLIGPYCPIYGLGAIIMTILINSKNDIITVFIEAVVICSVLEYLTSYIMEKMFKIRWWDYSKDKYNINGRVCLRTMIGFGIGGVAIVLVASPNMLLLINFLSTKSINILSLVLLILFLTDLITSYTIISGLKKIPKKVRKDSTEEVTKMVKEVLISKNYFYKRLVKSFPDFEAIVKKYDKKIEKQKRKIEKEKKKLKELKNK